MIHGLQLVINTIIQLQWDGALSVNINLGIKYISFSNGIFCTLVGYNALKGTCIGGHVISDVQ